MCGNVMYRKICHSLAPSIFAASMTSSGRLCRPARRMSIMNGVHCQISDSSIATSGASLIQSGCGGLSDPNRFQTAVRRPLNNPYSGL